MKTCSVSFERETDVNSKREAERLQKDIDDLASHTYYKAEYPNLKCTFNPLKTMIDGKSKNSITGNKSTQSCSDCKATPTQIKEDQVEHFEVKNTEWLCCGARSLHTGPRLMEWCIKCSAAKRAEKFRSDETKRILEEANKGKGGKGGEKKGATDGAQGQAGWGQ